MTTAFEIAQSFNLKKRGKEFRGDCPFCQAKKQELAVWDKSTGIGCRCYYGGCDSIELFRVLVGLDGSRIVSAKPYEQKDFNDVKRTEWALRIWNETINAKQTLAERYLKSRGISLNIPSDIRFHVGLKHVPSGLIFPAMIAAVRDANGNLKAVHRTYLDQSGLKAAIDLPKMTLGPVGGFAIQLSPTQEILGLAEGIETALSAMQMSELPVWSAINAGNLKRIILPDCVREVVIFADNGAPGVKAANEAAAVFHHEGRTVQITYPPDGYGDFNDLLKVKGGAA